MTERARTSIKIAGISGAGINMVSRIMKEALPDGVEAIAVDVDSRALHMAPIKDKVLLDIMPFRGSFCGTTAPELRSMYSASRNAIREAFSKTGFVLLVAGLGGATGSTLTPLIASMLRTQGVPVLGIFTAPFSFDGRNRAAQTEDAIHVLKQSMNTFFVFPNNDMLTLTENAAITKVYDAANDFVAHVVSHILQAFPYPETCGSMSFVQMTALGAGGVGCIGVGIGTGEHRDMDALNNAMQFIGQERYGKASMIAVIIEGDKKRRIDQIGRVHDLVKKHAQQRAEICLGLILNDQTVQSTVTLLAAGFHDRA
jgi:cell division protein FtsZ